MNKTRWYCDRCGKEITKWRNNGLRVYRRKLRVLNIDEDEYMDFCAECSDSLRKWLNMEGEDDK